MGWSLALQLHRARPLSEAERIALRETLLALQDWPWEQGGIALQVPVKRRKDGILGQALVPVPPPNLGGDDPGDHVRLLEAAQHIAARLPGVAVCIEDDQELLGSEDGLVVVGGDGSPRTWVDTEAEAGDWEPALQPLPPSLPAKLLEAVALLEAAGAAPPEDKAGQRALAKAQKTVSSAANLGKLVLLLDEDAVPRPQKLAVRELLKTVDQATLAIVCIKKHKKLPYSCGPLLRQAEAALEDVAPVAEAWLALWQRGKSRYHWGDMGSRIPDRLLGRMARLPAATAQLIEDLVAAREEWDDEAACRRAGEAARTLGLAATAEAAVALVEAAVFCRVRRRGGDFQRHTGRGTMEGLANLVHGPLEPAGDWTQPTATLRLALQRLGQYDKDSPGHLLRALAVAQPADTLALLLELEDAGGLPLKAVCQAAGCCPEPGAADLLRRMSHSPKKDDRSVALDALVSRDGVAALPWWLARARAEDPDEHARHMPPYTIERHGLRRQDLPRSVADWEQWFREHDLETVTSAALPAEERAMLANLRRPYPTMEGLRADLTALHRSQDASLALALAVGAAVHARHKSDWDDAFDWSDPEGLGLPLGELPPAEWPEAVRAMEGLPEQRCSALMAAVLEQDGDFGPWLAHRASYDGFERKTTVARLKAEERAWWEAHAGDRELDQGR